MGKKHHHLPDFDVLWLSYPNGEVPDVANLIGGKVASNIKNPDMPNYKDTCAIRVSRALNYSGQPVQQHVGGARTNSGSDAKWYVYGVGDLHRYLVAYYGEPDVIKESADLGGVTAADLANEHGIIEFENYHMDLWNGSSCKHQSYFGAVTKVFLWRAPRKNTGAPLP